MPDLPKAEIQILKLIANNPFIGQAEIAKKLNLARSTVAVHITQLVDKGHVLGRGYILPPSRKISCIGGIALNRKYALAAAPVQGTSNPAVKSQSHGGVARNIAENLGRLGVNVSLVSVVGDDEAGRELLSQMRELGVDVSQVSISDSFPTAEYTAVFDPGNELVLGLSSMDIMDRIDSAQIERSWSHICSSEWVVLDCNLPAETIAFVLQSKPRSSFKIAVDTVSVSKAKRLPEDLSAVDLLFTNRAEAVSILNQTPGTETHLLEDIAASLKTRGANGIVLTDGAHGHLTSWGAELFTTPALASEVVNVSGAGDALVAGVLFKLLCGAGIVESAFAGAVLSALTIESTMDVRQDLTVESLTNYETGKRNEEITC